MNDLRSGGMHCVKVAKIILEFPSPSPGIGMYCLGVRFIKRPCWLVGSSQISDWSQWPEQPVQKLLLESTAKRRYKKIDRLPHTVHASSPQRISCVAGLSGAQNLFRCKRIRHRGIMARLCVTSVCRATRCFGSSGDFWSMVCGNEGAPLMDSLMMYSWPTA